MAGTFGSLSLSACGGTDECDRARAQVKQLRQEVLDAVNKGDMSVAVKREAEAQDISRGELMWCFYDAERDEAF
ncbi:hypothetical protein [Acrocarpospora macrocephala]|uniref:hypothetical protein n=1 Tax=Acrocarpospora macrocephala TaxID=150177 RepID=UPI0012D32D65|nr:hypothetical protein [Acrocarpospora macrocephala]